MSFRPNRASVASACFAMSCVLAGNRHSVGALTLPTTVPALLPTTDVAPSPPSPPSPPPPSPSSPPPAAPSPSSATSSPATSLSPSPGVTAAPLPSPSPSESASSALRSQPIQLERTRVGIVPGGTLAIAVNGGAGALAARSSSPSVDATYDGIAGKVYLTARTLGNARVTVYDSAGDSARVEVLIAPAAGVVPADVTLDFGGNVSPQFALARANAEIARQAQLQPKATLDIGDIVVPSTLHAGDRFDAQAHVNIGGANAFVDAVGTTNVHLRVAQYPKLDPQILLYSDDPERLDASADGVLYRSTIEPARPARAYVYHVSDSPDRRLYFALQATATPARVQILGYSAGPENAFSYVGHRATLQYLLERGAQESAIVNVAADTPFLFPLTSRPMRAGDLIASIFDLRVLEGDALSVSVVAVSGDRDPVEVSQGPEVPSDGHGRRGAFSLARVPPLGLSYTVGAAEPVPFAIGAPTIANLRAGERALGGDYGVLRGIALELTNPSAAAQNVYFYESPAGGNATTTMWFTGDPTPTEIACVRVPANRYAIKAFELAPGETRNVTGEYMTDGTSYFPLLFGLTGTPPSPPPGPYSPDACTPKQPPPGTSSSAPPTPPAPPAPSATSSPAATSAPAVTATP